MSVKKNNETAKMKDCKRHSNTSLEAFAEKISLKPRRLGLLTSILILLGKVSIWILSTTFLVIVKMVLTAALSAKLHLRGDQTYGVTFKFVSKLRTPL
jgi:hypothetical protein